MACCLVDATPLSESSLEYCKFDHQEQNWNVNRNSYIFIQENALENVVCKVAAILSRPQCVKHWVRYQCVKITIPYIWNAIWSWDSLINYQFHRRELKAWLFWTPNDDKRLNISNCFSGFKVKSSFYHYFGWLVYICGIVPRSLKIYSLD